MSNTSDSTFTRDEGLQMLRDTKYADFTIKCADSSWAVPVHKVILSACSPFFRATIQGGFKESEENILTIGESYPHIVAAVVASLYTGTLELDVNKIWPMDFPAEMVPTFAAPRHVLSVYLLADRLMVAKVKNLARRKLIEVLVQGYDIDETLQEVVELLCLAHTPQA